MDLGALVERGRVRGTVYTDPGVFDAEMDRIFKQAWVYVGHESQVKEPGDYLTTFLGRQPVILARGADDGALRVLFNRCRHRASLVCRAEAGNASFFKCPYHGWAYDTAGRLVGVPFKRNYGDDFDLGDLGLSEVPHVASYRGFVFASEAAEPEPLEDHLDRARRYLDIAVDEGPEGIELTAGVQRYGYDGNWKLQLENVVDNYHVSVVHRSFVDMLAERTGQRGRWHDGLAKDLGHGHSVMEFPTATGPATGGAPFNLVVFPNLMIIGFQVRALYPVHPGRTEVASWPTMLKGVSDDVNAKRLRIHEESFGPAGFVGPDDVEVSLGRVQEGLAVQADDWMLLTRGLGDEEPDEWGAPTGHITDEVGQRALYRRWRELMVER